MGVQISMALDDIIRANNIVLPRGGGGAGRKIYNTRYAGGGRGVSGAGRYGRTGSFARGRYRGGICKSAHYYKRGDYNSIYEHGIMFNNFEWNGPANVRVTKYVPASTTAPTKLLISNLDFGVSETDIQELFSDYGTVESSTIHYDKSGNSLGTAEVIFERRADAMTAMKNYKGVPLDGKPMGIQLATSTTLATALWKGIGDGSSGGGGHVWGNINRGGSYRYHSSGGPRGYIRRGWGRIWTRGRFRMGRNERHLPTVEELDAELDECNT